MKGKHCAIIITSEQRLGLHLISRRDLTHARTNKPSLFKR